MYLELLIVVLICFNVMVRVRCLCFLKWKKCKLGDRYINVLLCCIKDIFMGYFVKIEWLSYNYS